MFLLFVILSKNIKIKITEIIYTVNNIFSIKKKYEYKIYNKTIEGKTVYKNIENCNQQLEMKRSTQKN